MKFWILLLTLIAGTASPSLVMASPRPIPPHDVPLCVPGVLTLSRQVAALLEQNNMSTLSRYVDTGRGLRFSPEVYGRQQDVHLSRQVVAGLRTDKKLRVWGDYDGEGGPIKLNWGGYRKRFVWTRDFTRGAQVSINRPLGGRSTVINNLRRFYPNSTLVEFYLPSTSDKVMDWASLWLVWKPSGGTWRLIGIAHDQWST